MIAATKKDMENVRTGIMKSVYGVGIVQLIAINKLAAGCCNVSYQVKRD